MQVVVDWRLHVGGWTIKSTSANPVGIVKVYLSVFYGVCFCVFFFSCGRLSPWCCLVRTSHPPSSPRHPPPTHPPTRLSFSSPCLPSQRAINTLWSILEKTDLMWIPVVRTWRLNERHYGALQVGAVLLRTAARFETWVYTRGFSCPVWCSPHELE